MMCLGIEKPELVRKVMCVHAGTTANPTFAAFSVVNKPAYLLPLDGIHEFFVGHGGIYPARCGFCRVDHEFLEVSWAMVGTASSNFN
jgi:hypothetical protein